MEKSIIDILANELTVREQTLANEQEKLHRLKSRKSDRIATGKRHDDIDTKIDKTKGKIRKEENNIRKIKKNLRDLTGELW